ncbi:MAG: tetratricopeptide repeat protein [Vulcanimicrobiota bacterium]
MNAKWSPASIVLIIISIILEIAAIVMVYNQYPDYNSTVVARILAAHVLAATAAAITCYFFQGERKRIYPFAFVMILTIPVLGYVNLFQILSAHKRKANVGLYEDYREHISAAFRKVDNVEKLKSSFDYLKKGIELEPIKDAMEEKHTFADKMGLIRNLGRLSDRMSIRTLKDLLDDENMNVRYYAGEEVAKVIEQYNIFINGIKKDIEKEPKNSQLYAELASLLMGYAFSGLFNREQTHFQLENALDNLERSIQLDPNQYDANYLAASIYYYLHRYDTALEFFNKAIEVDPHNLRALVGKAKCLWEEKEMKELDEVTNRISEDIEEYDGSDKEMVREFIACWREENAS